MRKVTTEDDHSFRIEITIAAAILKPDRRVLGDNLSDVTFAFEAPAARPPRALSDPEINGTIVHYLSPVIAAIQGTLMQMGYSFEGPVEEPMTEHSHEVGRGLSDPITVHLQMPTKEARA